MDRDRHLSCEAVAGMIAAKHSPPDRPPRSIKASLRLVSGLESGPQRPKHDAFPDRL